MYKAHEVTTVYRLNGSSRMFVGRYIVIAKSSSKANSLIPLRETEEVIHVEEMQHIVIMESENGNPESN